MNSIFVSEIKRGDFIICILKTISNKPKFYGVWNNDNETWFEPPTLLQKDARRIRRQNQPDNGYWRYSVKQADQPKLSNTRWGSRANTIVRGIVSDAEEAEDGILLTGVFLDLENNKFNTIQLEPTVKVLIQ